MITRLKNERWEGTRYQMRHGSMEEKKQKDEHGRFVKKFGKVKDGQKNGKRA